MRRLLPLLALLLLTGTRGEGDRERLDASVDVELPGAGTRADVSFG